MNNKVDLTQSLIIKDKYLLVFNLKGLALSNKNLNRDGLLYYLRGCDVTLNRLEHIFQNAISKH